MAGSQARRAGGEPLTRLLVATALYWFSLYLYVPVLPLHAEALGAGPGQIGAVVGAYAIAQVLLRVPIGVAADLLGRRKPFALMAGACSLVGALGLLAATGFVGLFWARALTGVAAAGWVAISVLYANSVPVRRISQAMSRLVAVNGIGLMLATGLGGLVAEHSSRATAFGAGAVAAGVATVLLATCKEPPAAAGPGVVWRDLVGVVRARSLWLVAGVGAALQFVTFSTSFGWVPIVARDLGSGDGAVGLLTAGMLAASLVGTLAAPALRRRFRLRGTLVATSVVVALATLAVVGVHSWAGLAAVQAVAGLGRGAQSALLMAAAVEVVPPKHRATAMGFYQATYAIGMLAGPLTAGALADDAGTGAVFVLSTLR